MAKIDSVHKLIDYFNLEGEVDDYDAIHESIERDILFKGANLWILVFAIIVASVGLNMNSTAVIIGAMLISPLMGPINGMGYSIATYNFALFRRAIKNFVFAVGASLAASTLYFAISPISTAHSELLARTSPTIYDVLIALFGGLAGIVAISSKFKGNVIPGVAIATALMPPLCTAGYGVATGQFAFFFGALYLFTINTVFIAISSILISQILKFPIRTLVDADQKKRVNQWISVVILLVVIPSLFFGYRLVQKEEFNENASRYVSNISAYEGSYLLNYEISADERAIRLVYGGHSLSDDDKNSIREKAKDFGLNNAHVEFQQGLSFDFLSTRNTEVENLRFEVNKLTSVVRERERQLDSLQNKKVLGKDILEEIKSLYPQVTGSAYSESAFYGDSSLVSDGMSIIILQLKDKDLPDQEREKIQVWLTKRLKSDKIKLYLEKVPLPAGQEAPGRKSRRAAG